MNKTQLSNFGARWGEKILKYRWLVLAVTLIFGLFLAYGMSRFKMDNDYRVFFGEDNPQLQAFDALQDKYTKDDNVYIILAPKEGKVFDRQILLAMEELVDSCWMTPFSSRVDALTNYQHTIAIEDDMYVNDLISDIENRTDAEIAKAEQIALHEPLLRDRLINKDGSVAGINVVAKKPNQEEYAAINKARQVFADSTGTEAKIFPSPEAEIAEYLRVVLAELEEKYPQLDTRLSGVVMLSNAFAEAAFKDIQTLVPAMYLVIFITLIFISFLVAGLLPGFSGFLKTTATALGVTFATIMLLMLSILGGMGSISWLGVAITSVSFSAPTMILTLAVADSIHILITMLQSMRSGMTQRESIVESLRLNFMPVFITSATTVVGFLTMNFAESPPFRDLGNAAAIGVAVAFILSVTLLPVLLSIFPMWTRKDQLRSKSSLLSRLADFIILRRKPLMVASAAVAVGLIFFASKNIQNEQFVEYFDKDIAFREDTDFMIENITGIYNIEYSVDAVEEGGISNPSYLKTLEEFELWWKIKPNVKHVNTYAEVARKVNKSMHGDDQSFYKMPENRQEAAQFLLLYEMSLPFGLDLNNQINVDKSETRLTVTVDGITAKELIAHSNEGEQWLSDHGINGESNIGISTGIMFAHLTQRQIQSMTLGGIWALILISIVLMFALRSFKYGLLSVIPNMVPVAMAFGVWYFLDGFITSGLAIVFSITIGIVVDDTVHILSKYLRARREQNATPEEAVRYAISKVGMAIITTTIVLSAGFFILGQSSFALNSGMAKLTAITIVIALLVDIFLLPPLLLLIDKVKR